MACFSCDLPRNSRRRQIQGIANSALAIFSNASLRPVEDFETAKLKAKMQSLQFADGSHEEWGGDREHRESAWRGPVKGGRCFSHPSARRSLV